MQIPAISEEWVEKGKFGEMIFDAKFEKLLEILQRVQYTQALIFLNYQDRYKHIERTGFVSFLLLQILYTVYFAAWLDSLFLKNFKYNSYLHKLII